MTPEGMEGVLKQAETRGEARFRSRIVTGVVVLVTLGVVAVAGWSIYAAKRDADATERRNREDYEKGLEQIQRRGLERSDRGG